MTLIPSDPIERWRTVFTGVAGAPYYSNFYTSGSGVTELALDAVDDFWNGIRDHIWGALSWTVEGTVSLIDPATGTLVGIESAGDDRTNTGNASDMGLPMSNQAMLHWRTGEFVNGRELRGRLNIPGLTEAASTNSELTPSVATAILLAADNMLGLGGGFTAGFNGSMCVWSRTHGTGAYVSGRDINSLFAVLRSRRD